MNHANTSHTIFVGFIFIAPTPDPSNKTISEFLRFSFWLRTQWNTSSLKIMPYLLCLLLLFGQHKRSPVLRKSVILISNFDLLKFQQFVLLVWTVPFFWSVLKLKSWFSHFRRMYVCVFLKLINSIRLSCNNIYKTWQ